MKAILTDGLEILGEREVNSLEELQRLQDQADEATDRNLTWCLRLRDEEAQREAWRMRADTYAR